MDQKGPETTVKSSTTRGLDGTAFFRLANFELFVKPNKYVMVGGLIAITGCISYLHYMNVKKRREEEEEVQIRIQEDGSQALQKKKSRWD